MNSKEIRSKFLDYFRKRGHAIVPSSTLITDDPSVLLTTAGMQQFKPYFIGKGDAISDFGSNNTTSVQKCFRTSDIDEVGDESHLTFFEMLGNFSFGYKPGEPVSPKGGYSKKEAIQYAYEFLIQELRIKNKELSITVFGGDNEVPRDDESIKIWEELGFSEEKGNLSFAGRKDNFWGPTGGEGPCGPTTEIYVKNSAGESVEIWNLVFNEYYQNLDKSLRKLGTLGVDTGMGLERLAMVLQNKSNIFETDLFLPIITLLPDSVSKRTRRIVSDHTRGIAFLLSDGARPSNKEAGYVLRRLMRRVITHEYLAENSIKIEELLKVTVQEYKGFYQELNEKIIIDEFLKEKMRFLKTIKIGLKELERRKELDAPLAFRLYESFGLPYEVIKELGGDKTKNLSREDFDREFEKHQEKSRAGLEKKFGGHGLILNTGELKAIDEIELKKVTRLHTATHLLQQALRNVLGNEVHQAGSDITSERTRFDFTYSRKLTHEEIKKVEDEVNGIIQKNLPIQKVIMPKIEAEKTGALYYFSAKGGSASGGKDKYPNIVSVYYVGNSLEDAYSKEFCGGPHVHRTGEIGKFEIIKEEAVGAGTRRLRGKVE